MLVYNCTTGGINPFHWGEVGMDHFFKQNAALLKCPQWPSVLHYPHSIFRIDCKLKNISRYMKECENSDMFEQRMVVVLSFALSYLGMDLTLI